MLAPVTDAVTLKQLLDTQVSRKRAPAFAALVGTKDGVLVQAVSGVRRYRDAQAARIEDAWHIGSCTKAMTAALYARLVQQGRAQWGATAADLFPHFAEDMDPALRQTPIERFMQHRAGLADVGAPWLIARRADRRPLVEQREETARTWLTRSPQGAPGEFVYANVGYIIAGAAIERITGQPWEDALRQHVAEPLGLNGVGFGPPADVSGHRQGLLGGFAPILADNPPALGPAGTVHMPLESWAKFVQVFADPDGDFLSSDSIRRLTEPRDSESYALGWGAYSDNVAGNVLSHDGSNTFWHARASVLRDRNAYVLIAANAYSEATSASFNEIGASISQAIVNGDLR